MVDEESGEFSKLIQDFRQKIAECDEYDQLERRVLLERMAELENRPEPVTVVADDDEFEALRRKLNAVENENRNGRKYVSKLQEDIKRLEEEKMQLEKAASDTHGEILTNEVKEAQRVIDNLKMDVCQLKLEKNNLKHEVAAKVSELQTVQEELEEAKAEISQLEDEVVKLKAEIIQNDTEQETSKERISRIMTTMEARAAILDEVEAKLQESEAARNELAEAKTFWEDKAAKLERVVQQYGNEIQSLKSTANTNDMVYSEESLAHGKRMVENFYLSYYHTAESKHRLLLKETKEKDMALGRQGEDLNHVRQVLENLLDADPAAMRVAIDGLLASLDR
ncbi:hypothetical protein THRCLA_22067 [Thraustotheca clavata]|uniref:Uncharacterized protein n=1 Tax=Thraustotheca clavata TaxID=74557 RepID=A0A1V9ZCV3_9STRA|nr:hypothetical protein THRCLA_22067 [Thraustotheca clavata]